MRPAFVKDFNLFGKNYFWIVQNSRKPWIPLVESRAFAVQGALMGEAPRLVLVGADFAEFAFED